MFITENQNIAESILFLLSARESLSYMVEGSSVDHKDELKNFLMNEASDYEIIHMLMYEEMPNDKYNFTDEIRLFSNLKEQVLVNYNILNKYIGESIQTFINEVDLIHPCYSSAAPLYEFQRASENTLNEVFDKEGVGLQKAIDWVTKKREFQPIDLDKLQKSVATAIGSVGRKALAMQKKEVAINNLIRKGVKPDVARKLITHQIPYIKNVGSAGYIKGGDALLKKGATGAARAADPAGFLATLKQKAIAAAPTLQKAVTSQAGMAVGGAALAALALYASVKLYKRFMSKAAKSCAGQSGSAKTMCMKKHQHSAIAAQIKDLGSAMNACAKSKSPEKCKIPIQKKISNLQVKMQKMKAQIAA